MKISIVLPCYNEEHRVARVLKDIEDYLPRRPETFEILVVNDGSTDHTLRVVRSFSRLPIRILNSRINRGKGFAVRRGILSARGDWILFMDADASSDIRELDRFMKCGRRYDVIVGSRSVRPGLVKHPEGPIRSALGWLGHGLIGLVITREIKDLLCAFKLYRRSAARAIFNRQSANGMAADFEVIYLALRLNLRVIELPLSWWHQEGGSSHISWYLTSLWELALVRFNDLRGRYRIPAARVGSSSRRSGLHRNSPSSGRNT